MHTIYYRTCPEQIYEQFTERKTNLRNLLQVKIKRYKKEIGRNGVLWNSIGNDFKSQENLTTFKNKIKECKNKINQQSFGKETCIINNKNKDFSSF